MGIDNSARGKIFTYYLLIIRNIFSGLFDGVGGSVDPGPGSKGLQSLLATRPKEAQNLLSLTNSIPVKSLLFLSI